jgi:hypothetical protein
MFGGDEADKSHDAGGRRKTARISELRGNRQGSKIADAPEASQATHRLRKQLARKIRAHGLIENREPRGRLLHGPQVGAEGLLERGDRPL